MEPKTTLDLMAEGYADSILKRSPKKKILRSLFIHVFKHAYDRGYNRVAGTGKQFPFINEIELDPSAPLEYIAVYKGSGPGPTGDPNYQYVYVPKYMIKDCYRKGEGYQPTSDLLTDPPTGGSGVPDKL